MAHLVFAAQAFADAFSAGIDTDCGYPKSNIVVPGGAPAPRGQTTRYAATLKHATLPLWAYPEDPLVAGKEGRVSIGTAMRQTLDATWDTATSNFIASQLE